MYTCIIIDDEELARGLIKNHLSQLDDFKLIASCESAIAASNILQRQKVDLLFLDIEMPVLKGTDFFKNLINKPKVIFTTAYRNYAIEGFQLNAVDYLLKPITFEKFFKAIEKFKTLQTIQISEEKETIKENYIFIRENRKHVKVKFEDILYVKSIKDYIKIQLKEKSHITKYSIASFGNLLDNRFVRIHRSYIVNKDKITAFTNYDVEINNVELPIGESYKKTISLL